MIKIDQIFNPLLKLLSVGGSSPRKKTMRYTVRKSVSGVIVSRHSTKKLAVTAARKIRGVVYNKGGKIVLNLDPKYKKYGRGVYGKQKKRTSFAKKKTYKKRSGYRF